MKEEELFNLVTDLCLSQVEGLGGPVVRHWTGNLYSIYMC